MIRDPYSPSRPARVMETEGRFTMPAILTLEKISKRFGAVVVADNIDLTLLRGEALGIIGPNGAGKTTLFGIDDRHGGARRRPRHVRGPRHHPHDAGAALPHGDRPLVPGAAAVRRHDVFENLVVAAASAAAGASARSMPAAPTARPMRPGRQGQPPRRRADPARPQAAGAGPRARHRAARVAARRGRRRPDRARDARHWSTDQRRARRPASRSSGSSTSCMR